MAELADALDSGSSEGNFMQVQFLLPAPQTEPKVTRHYGSVFYLIIAVLKIAIGFFAQVSQTASFVISSQLTINIDKER